MSMIAACNHNDIENDNLQIIPEIRIISPDNCQYSFRFSGDTLYAESKAISPKDSLNSRVETLIRSYDTVLAGKDIENLTKIVKGIPRDTDVDSVRAKDVYIFEFLLDGKLIKHKNGKDTDVYSVLKSIRPYIQERRIQCCDFFEGFDSLPNE